MAPFRYQRRVVGLLAVALAWLAGTDVSAQTPPSTPQPPREGGGFTDVDELRLEDLLDLTVSIAAGRIQPVEEAPGIVSVITDEDIRRMGAQTLSDVLAIIPGFEVLTDNSGRPRIAVRGIVSPSGTSPG